MTTNEPNAFENFGTLLMIYRSFQYNRRPNYRVGERLMQMDMALSEALFALGGLEYILTAEPYNQQCQLLQLQLVVLLLFDLTVNFSEKTQFNFTELSEKYDQELTDLTELNETAEVTLDVVLQFALRSGQFDGRLEDEILPKFSNTILEALDQAINKVIGDITSRINGLYQKILDLSNNIVSDLKRYISDQFNTFKTDLFRQLGEVQTTIIDRLQGFITEKYDAFTTYSDAKFQTVQDAISGVLTSFREWVRNSWNPFEIAFASLSFDFAVFSESVKDSLVAITSLLVTVESTCAGIFTEVSASGLVLGNLVRSFTKFSGETANSLRNITDSIGSLKTSVDKLPDKIAEAVEKKLDEYVEKVADAVTLKIVGESYYKWNSVGSFYPTICFIYKERNATVAPRRTQIRLKLPLLSEEITEQYVEELKRSVEFLAPSAYEHGVLRANYVHGDKRFKTMVATSTREMATEVLRKLLIVMGEMLDEGNISYTEGKKRPSVTRRKTPLGNIDTQFDDYNQNFTVGLYKVVLLVNGLEQPIVLYPTN